MDAPAVEHFGDLDFRSEAREREGGEEAAFVSRGDNGGRIGESRGDARGELGGGDADFEREGGFFGGGDDVAGEGERGRSCELGIVNCGRGSISLTSFRDGGWCALTPALSRGERGRKAFSA